MRHLRERFLFGIAEARLVVRAEGQRQQHGLLGGRSEVFAEFVHPTYQFEAHGGSGLSLAGCGLAGGSGLAARLGRLELREARDGDVQPEKLAGGLFEVHHAQGLLGAEPETGVFQLGLPRKAPGHEIGAHGDGADRLGESCRNVKVLFIAVDECLAVISFVGLLAKGCFKGKGIFL